MSSLLFKAICSFVSTQFLNGCRCFFMLEKCLSHSWYGLVCLYVYYFFCTKIAIFFHNGQEGIDEKYNKAYTQHNINRKRNLLILLPKACAHFRWKYGVREWEKKGQQIRMLTFLFPLHLRCAFILLQNWWDFTSILYVCECVCVPNCSLRHRVFFFLPKRLPIQTGPNFFRIPMEKYIVLFQNHINIIFPFIFQVYNKLNSYFSQTYLCHLKSYVRTIQEKKNYIPPWMCHVCSWV